MRDASRGGLGDGQADDDVAEELEPLVVAAGLVRVLVEPAAVDERLLDEAEIPDREAEAFGDGGCGTHRSRRRSRGNAR
jgi:hypothetical protein